MYYRVFQYLGPQTTQSHHMMMSNMNDELFDLKEWILEW